MMRRTNMPSPAEMIRSQSKTEEPPYTRYALLNPYNLSVLAGAAVTSAATGEAWIALCAAAAEAVWLLLAPQSEVLRHHVFDGMWAAARKAEYEARLAGKVGLLVPGDQARVHGLLEQRGRIEELARDNPSFATSLVKSELARLSGLVEDFVDLGSVAARSERHLGTLDVAAMERAWAGYAAQVKAYPERDPRRAVAAKNMSVLKQRSERHADLARALGTARGQMDLIENTFRLLADEIVTMVSPSELGQRLDDLRIAVDAIRETVRDSGAEEIVEEVEPVRREGALQ
ncbi:Hypothetical protein A7982_01482 [Minicystis rosea]|nr:Hypothetical protein A7982_01482 [Minicystis rosea]